MYENLFKGIKIGNVEIKNRIATAPACMNFSNERGYVTEQNIAFYAARARGGFGLIIQEAAMASAMWQGCPEGLDVENDEVWDEYSRNYAFGMMLKMYNETHVSGMAEIVETVHAFGAKIFLQILACWGRQASHTPQELMIGPSPIPIEVLEENCPKTFDIIAQRSSGFLGKGKTPREATKAEIKRIVKDTAKSALLARQAGYDGVELHCAHGYFPGSFLSPLANRRTDEYGGSLENRMRVALEILQATKEAVGNSIVVGVRMSEDEHKLNGLTNQEVITIAKKLEKEGMDYFHLSSGDYEAINYAIPDGNGTMLDGAKGLADALSVPVITPGVHDPDLAERAIKEGKTTMISLGRQSLADADWANKVQSGKVKEIQKCIKCNTCWNYLWRPQALRCTVNPNLGRERYMPEYQRPSTKFRKMTQGHWTSEKFKQFGWK